MQFLASFQFEILYKQGKRNVVADAISRRPDFRGEQKNNTQKLSKLKFDNMIEMHAYIASLIDATELNKLFEKNIENDNTHKQIDIENLIGLVQHNNKTYKHLSLSKLVLVVPIYLPLRNFIIDAFYSSKGAEHIGRDKTVANI